VTPNQLVDIVLAAAREALTEIGCDASVLPQTADVERPRSPEHGDYSSTIALQLAKRVGLAPRRLAEEISRKLIASPQIASVDVAGPGFLNMRVEDRALGEIARLVVTEGRAYGHGTVLAGGRINIEFVSANPTGPVHIGGVRWAAVGDALTRLLRACGADTTTEYYFNDAGAQIDRFSASLLCAAKGEPPPRTDTSATTSPRSPTRSAPRVPTCSICRTTRPARCSAPRACA
jgi:arginyl-tRNA synthetase